MNSLKVMQAQSKATKSACYNTHGGGAVHVQFQGNKMHMAKGQGLNVLLDNAVKEVIKQNKPAKATDVHKSGLEEEPK